MTRLSVRALAHHRGIDLTQGIRSHMHAEQTSVLRTWLTDHQAESEIWWGAHSATTLIDNGPVGEKFTMVVVGDGWAEQDQADYRATVRRLLTDPTTGVFAQDFFAERRADFNLIRIDLTSVDSQIGTKTYALNTEGTAWELQSQVDRDTALGLYYNGQNSLNLVWMESTPDNAPTGASSARRLEQALATWAPDHDVVFQLAHSRQPDGTPNFGGVAGDGVYSAPNGIGWEVVAHELGHVVGGLADEYFQTTSTGCGTTAYSGGEPGAVNITANSDENTLKWRHKIASGVPVPTGTGGCATYNAGPRPASWDDTSSVGLFEGAGGPNVATGLYRPVINCRMRGNAPDFCPVCREAMDLAVSAALTDRRPDSVDGYLRLVVTRRGKALDVTSVRRLPGGLRRPQVIGSGLAAEVMIGGRRLALRGLGSLGEVRALDRNGEHRTESTAVQRFVVRLALADLQDSDLDTLAVRLVSVEASTMADRSRGRAREPQTVAVHASGQLADPVRSALPPRGA